MDPKHTLRWSKPSGTDKEVKLMWDDGLKEMINTMKVMIHDTDIQNEVDIIDTLAYVMFAAENCNEVEDIMWSDVEWLFQTLESFGHTRDWILDSVYDVMDQSGRSDYEEIY